MEILAAVLVISALVLMASGRFPAVLVLAGAIVIAGLLRIATPAELFSGLSNGGVITVAAMLVIAKGVLSTGVVSRVMYRLLLGVTTATQALLRLIPPVGVASALINTTPIVAMLIPATKELEQNTGVPARQVLLPVAHATTLMGSTTLIGTSSNLLIAGLAAGAGVSLSMFTFVPLALPVALIGWVVLLVTAPLMLKGKQAAPKQSLDWRMEVRLGADANARGRRAKALGLLKSREFELVTIERWGEKVPLDEILRLDDKLVFRTSEAGVRHLWGSPRFGLDPQHLFAVTISDDVGTVRDLEESDDLLVVAARSKKALRKTKARAGDTIFVTAPSPEVLEEHRALGLWQDFAGKAPQVGRTWRALAILFSVILAASTGIAPVEIVAVAGAFAMVIVGVITPRSAVRALDWNIIFVLAGSVGLGAIVVSSGLGRWIADAIATLSGGTVFGVVAVLAIGTTILTNIVTNAAAAAILTPICLKLATTTGIDPVLLLILIGTCISFTFINPFSHQSNLMVLEPGGYSFATFARYGIPLVAACLVAVIAFAVLLA